MADNELWQSWEAIKLRYWSKYPSEAYWQWIMAHYPTPPQAPQANSAQQAIGYNAENFISGNLGTWWNTFSKETQVEPGMTDFINWLVSNPTWADMTPEMAQTTWNEQTPQFQGEMMTLYDSHMQYDKAVEERGGVPGYNVELGTGESLPVQWFDYEDQYGNNIKIPILPMESFQNNQAEEAIFRLYGSQMEEMGMNSQELLHYSAFVSLRQELMEQGVIIDANTGQRLSFIAKDLINGKLTPEVWDNVVAEMREKTQAANEFAMAKQQTCNRAPILRQSGESNMSFEELKKRNKRATGQIRMPGEYFLPERDILVANSAEEARALGAQSWIPAATFANLQNNPVYTKAVKDAQEAFGHTVGWSGYTPGGQQRQKQVKDADGNVIGTEPETLADYLDRTYPGIGVQEGMKAVMEATGQKVEISGTWLNLPYIPEEHKTKMTTREIGSQATSRTTIANMPGGARMLGSTEFSKTITGGGSDALSTFTPGHKDITGRVMTQDEVQKRRKRDRVNKARLHKKPDPHAEDIKAQDDWERTLERANKVLKL